ncbi:MAG: hypothetical protein WCI55_07710 [Armatimonadota bacterium]
MSLEERKELSKELMNFILLDLPPLELHRKFGLGKDRWYFGRHMCALLPIRHFTQVFFAGSIDGDWDCEFEHTANWHLGDFKEIGDKWRDIFTLEERNFACEDIAFILTFSDKGLDLIGLVLGPSSGWPSSEASKPLRKFPFLSKKEYLKDESIGPRKWLINICKELCPDRQT